MTFNAIRKSSALRIVFAAAAVTFSFADSSFASSAKEIDVSVDAALENFQKKVYGGADLVKKAKGILVMPDVVKGGFGLGGEYGEGALRVAGKTVGYYNIIGGSFGFQIGVQVKTVYLFFMEDAALTNFQTSSGWQVGVDGSVALIKIGADASLDTTKTNEPILGFVLGQKGLMYNLTIEGAKFNRVVK